MKVFLDTNVLVSALATRGLCSDVLRETLSFHQLVISKPLLVELERILKEKIKLSENLVSESLDFLKQTGLMSETFDKAIPELKDNDDVPIINSALNGGVELFVTGDKEVLKLKVVNEMMVVDPRSFWELIKSQQAT
ncbi:MAG: putative toxin-antitoxin system toxin component, PIN family [Proteobacteria bacterium]|nr:putative toxin-antitoxin system toxin component, PIN family [Pseudomonadota bacterium]